MLEAKSPLAGASFDNGAIAMREAPDFALTLYAGSAVSLRREVGPLPEFGLAQHHGAQTFFRQSQNQVLVLGDEVETRLCATTPLSSSRCRLAISGDKARALLQACCAVDLSPDKFGPQAVALTQIHHMPVMIHALPDGGFHLYGPRSFARALWDWLLEVAQTFV
jgi:heterotetrameric sarcosine oxidase gamma subunit